MLVILRLHYVPGGLGSPVCPKRSVPWDFGHIFLCFQDLLRLVKFSYVVLLYAVVVISRRVTETLRYFTVIHDLSRLLARSITACYVLVRPLRFDQGVTLFFSFCQGQLRAKRRHYAIYLAFLCFLCAPQQPTAELIKNVREFNYSSMA